MKSKKKALNIQLPEDIVKELERYVHDSGYNKTQVVMSALNHYLTLKHEESDFKAQYPNNRIKSRMIVEVVPRDDEKPKMSSVLAY